LFGNHDYRYQLAKVAKDVLGKERGRVFCAQHLRSARCTHFLEAGATLPAAAELLDHTRLSTTSIYARPSYQGLVAEMSRQEKVGRRRKKK
jgi:site-specific recombinase XerD